MTENLNYNTPAAGTVDWNVPLNENFEKLDTDVEVRDTQANRTNYAPKDGAKFLATDTGRVYLGDGSAWVEAGHLQGATGGGVTESLIQGNVVALARDLSSPQVIDPDDTATPVQDAMDLLGGNGGGEVQLPPFTVTDAGPITPYTDTAILGFGPDVSKLSIGSTDTDGIVFDDPSGVARVKLDDFALNGPGRSASSGVAIHHVDGDTQDLYVGRMVLWGWNNSVYRVEQGVGPFQCRHDLMTIYECDAGDQDGLFDFRSYYGPANWFGTVAVYPTAGFTGANTTVFFTRGGTQIVDFLTMGGSSGVALHQTWDAQVRMENVHWEPTDLRSTPGAIVRLLGRAPGHIGGVKHVTGTADYVYELGYDSFNGSGPARKFLGPYYLAGADASINTNTVNLAWPNEPDMPSFYYGLADDVTVTHSEGGGGALRALGSAGTGL
jgi:hypothetical protein